MVEQPQQRACNPYGPILQPYTASLQPYVRSERFLGDKLRDGTIINAIPGLYHALGDKPSLARLQVHCFRALEYGPLARSPAPCALRPEP